MASRHGWCAAGLSLATCFSWPRVATSVWCRDMGGSKGGRDMEKWRRDIVEMGLGCVEVATSFLRSRHEW